MDVLPWNILLPELYFRLHLARNEMKKHCQYGQCVNAVEHGSLIPLNYISDRRLAVIMKVANFFLKAGTALSLTRKNSRLRK